MQTSIDVFAKARGPRALRRCSPPPARRTSSPTSTCWTHRRCRSSRWREPSGSCSAPTTTSGLTGDERVHAAGARDALHRYGTGLTGSRLLNGTIPLHLELEREIAEWMGTEDALVFTTGHQANLGTLGTLLGPADTVIVDSGDHASILDGCLLSRAKMRPFRHNRLEKLEKMLERAQRRRRRRAGRRRRRLLDGGRHRAAGEICELCERYGARLMVDEAHGAGVLGARGAGSGELLGVADRVDLRMGTFSKSLASCGGFVAGPAEVIDYLRDLLARVPVHRLGRSRGGRRRARGAARRCARRGPRRCCEQGARERTAAARRPARARLRGGAAAGAAGRRRTCRRTPRA